jgi:serine/threonine protein kinase
MVATNPGADASELELVSRWLGKTIKEKYVVETMIGSGGMAVVYAARHHRNGKRFAVKMLHRELSLNTFIRQRFLREGYVANRVDHPGAVAVIDDDVTEDGSAFLVMELLVGTTVESLWESHSQRLPLDCVLAIAEQLLDVLTAAHAQNIVHRDLKPANMFLVRDGSVKILDFGIARLRESTDSSKTESGTTLGTPLFMPPEQASGRSRDVDGRTDLWAIGATMFSLLSGQYVHDGENATQVLISAATSQARSLTTAVVDPHPVITALIDKALAFDSDDRWESAAAMRAAVAAAHESVFGTPISRDILKRYVQEATGRPSISGDASSKASGAISAVSGVAPTMQTPTPSGQPSAASSGSRSGGTKRLPTQPTRMSPSQTPVNSNVAVASTTTKESPAPHPAASRAWPIAAGIAAITLAAGGLWVAHSRTSPTAPIGPETVAVAPVAAAVPVPTVAAVQPPPAATIAAAPSPAQPAAALTDISPERPASPAAGSAPAKHPGAPKTSKHEAAQPQPAAVAQPDPPPAAAPPPPPPVAAKPDTPPNKTPALDRGNPFN